MTVGNYIITEQDGKRFVSDMLFRFENCIPQSIGFLLPNIVYFGKVRYFLQLVRVSFLFWFFSRISSSGAVSK